jgi:hypothetical protein
MTTKTIYIDCNYPASNEYDWPECTLDCACAMKDYAYICPIIKHAIKNRKNKPIGDITKYTTRQVRRG